MLASRPPVAHHHPCDVSLRSRPVWSRRRAGLLTVTAAATLLALTSVTACAGGKSGDGSGQGFVTSADGVSTVKVADRHAAPAISGTTIDGKPLSLSDPQFKGKVVVLNVWGSWCGPCRGEAKNLQRYFTENESKGVEFVGINTRDSTQDNAIAFERDKGVTYPSLWDPDGDLILKFRGTLNPQSIPTTLVIDRNGKVAARFLGGMTYDQAHELIDPVLNENT